MSPLPSPLVTPTATSCFPSLLKSPASATCAFNITVGNKATDGAGSRTGKNTTLETPPTGVGFTTVTEAVSFVATSLALIVALSWLLETTRVVRALPFQWTVEWGTNPVPLTVKVNAWWPGATVAGTRGWLTKGAGLFCAIAAAQNSTVNSHESHSDFIRSSSH